MEKNFAFFDRAEIKILFKEVLIEHEHDKAQTEIKLYMDKTV